MKSANFNKIKDKLLSLKNSGFNYKFRIPNLWLDPSGNPENVETDSIDFFLFKFDEILSLSKKTDNNIADDENRQICYNLLVRLSTAYDHDGDGKIEIDTHSNRFRETGTFLKTIALLPYIKSLGVNVLYLLPITSIGKCSQKGNLGSPYSIRNPYKLDENLSEPILGIDCESQFCALVESAHLLGMKVISEFVFRTTSLDSELALDHPDWFYWIKNEIPDRSDSNPDGYGSPIFSYEEIELIKQKISNSDFAKLPSPDKKFRSMFTDVPVEVNLQEGKITGIDANGLKLRIPPAFADWPPDDPQPPWSDVTYLKLYDHPAFNYIAYNTIRMYDKKLNQKKYAVKDLWDYISGIIPYYVKSFGIDGIMLDMGHALPEALRKEIVRKARKTRKNFIFWEENFVLSQKSVDDGYNAVAGYMPFDAHHHAKLVPILKMMAAMESPIPFFLSTETHNTPRTASRFNSLDYSRFSVALCSLLNGVFFIHSGFELGETTPVNTGLDFSEEEQSKYPADKLPLFSASELMWNSESDLLQLIREMHKIRKDFISNGGTFNHGFEMPETYNPYIIALLFRNEEKSLLLVANINPGETQHSNVFLNETHLEFIDLLGGSGLDFSYNLNFQLRPFEFKIGYIRSKE